MKGLYVVSALMLVIAPAAVAAPGGSADEGKEIFAKKCVMCHGKDASGDTPVAKALKVTIPPLGSKEVQALSDAEIQKVITEGKGKMKPVQDLSKGDLANLVAFIRGLAKK
jgi:mono/diheme cytochrome c family protein